jgi:ring-1,2-phenylacetyl-CoA epoxidase subunit PaaE
MFQSLTIKNIQKETLNSVSIEFDVPNGNQNDYSFKAGQFLTLKADLDGEDVRRSYSICSSPNSGELKVVVKQIPNGKFSTYANTQLKTGDKVEVAKPSGTFFLETTPSNSKKYVLIAAGSGITPVISILKTVLADEPSSSVDLFYGNKSKSQTIFKSELESLKTEHGNRLNLNFIYSEEKGESRFHTGRIEGRKIKKIFKKESPVANVNEVFMCGPQAMTENVQAVLLNKFDFPATQVHFELFTATAPVATKKKSTAGKSVVTAILDGKDIQFPVNKNESILEAGLRAGNDIPFSCQGGVCGACKCIVVSGEAEMEMNLALSDDEVDSGYSLACQTKCNSEEVKVSFDF